MTYPKGYEPPIKPRELLTFLFMGISVAISALAWWSQQFPETLVNITIIIMVIFVGLCGYILWTRLQKRKK